MKLNPQQLRDAAALAGFSMLNVGLVGIDWRLSAIVAGLALIAVAVTGTVRTR